MKRAAQSPRDRILWILNTCGGKADQATLQRRTKLMKSELEPVLDGLQQEGKISRINTESSEGQLQEIIMLKSSS